MIKQIRFNAYETFTSFNDSTIAGLFLYPAHIVPSFIPLVLFALFTITLLTTFFSQKRITGMGDFFASFAVAGYFTAIIAFIMTLVPNLINVETLVIAVAIAILGTILLLTTQNK